MIESAQMLIHCSMTLFLFQELQTSAKASAILITNDRFIKKGECMYVLLSINYKI